MSFFDTVWFLLLITFIAALFTCAVVYYVFVQVAEHRPFCESLGLEYDGFANYSGSIISCVGFNEDKAIIRNFLFEEGEYYEVQG